MKLMLGDCREVLKTLADASVDSVVCDPPYELGFMGKAWDASGVAYDVNVWRECLRVLKPGGHLLAFGGSRTYHRLACAVEDAGFEIRDQIMWVYGSGFPKSLNLNGASQGWGTALKPAHEPIVVARRPLIGTVAENVLAFGCGAINVDGCRVGSGTRPRIVNRGLADPRGDGFAGKFGSTSEGETTLGRWPANLIHDGSAEVVERFPQTTSGTLKPFTRTTSPPGYALGMAKAGRQVTGSMEGSTGSAARFFYTAKADATDRDQGLDGFALGTKRILNGGIPSAVNSDPRGMSGGGDRLARNHHPTVKPTDLMRYLCRLVTPPGGIVLDPFLGSGSTGKAAALERFEFIGIEIDPDYLDIARARIAHMGVAPAVEGMTPREVTPRAGAQMPLFA